MRGWDFFSPKFSRHISILRSFPEFRRVKCSHALNKKPVNIPRPWGHLRDLENWWTQPRCYQHQQFKACNERPAANDTSNTSSLKRRSLDNERVVLCLGPNGPFLDNGPYPSWITWRILEKVDLNSLLASWFSTLCSQKETQEIKKHQKLGGCRNFQTSTVERLDAAPASFEGVFVSLQTKSCYYMKRRKKHGFSKVPKPNRDMRHRKTTS